MFQAKKADILKALQADILRLQGFKSMGNTTLDLGLGPIKDAFPNQSFPLGAVHEFLSTQPENAAATSGFIAGLLSSIIGHQGTALWISSSRIIFPPALKNFGLEPDHVIFIDLQKEKHVAWAMEEALKCHAVSAVVGEMHQIDFTTSRRLQLAVEQSQVTGFIVRKNHRSDKQGKINTTACVSRWKITPLPSIPAAPDMPGIGFPKWKVELLRMRNGKSGVWEMQWVDGRFIPVEEVAYPQGYKEKKAG